MMRSDQWLGMVAQVSDEFGDHNINCMHLSGPGKQFHWPTKVDTCWSSIIVCVIEAPVLSFSSLRKYIISENDYKIITEAQDKLIIIIMVLLGTFSIYSLDNLIYIHNPS